MKGGAGGAFPHCRGASSGHLSEFPQVKTEDRFWHWVSAGHKEGPMALLLGGPGTLLCVRGTQSVR